MERFTTEELATLGIRKLELRFQTKINPDEYCLSYSGGLDSELLRWFIKEYLKEKSIRVVSVNTYREHNEIRQRMYKYADDVLYPVMLMPEIKERYGMPCFTKRQDEMIDRYQRGSRSPHTMSWIYPPGPTKYKLNKTAKTRLLNGTLPKISKECCTYTKRYPLTLYQAKTGLKPIIAVRGAESISRKNSFQTCLNKNGEFRPIYDFSDEMISAIYQVYQIEKPKIYDILDRTGCIGCPYGLHGGNTLKELNMVTPAQRKYAIDSFGESYKVLGLNVDYQEPVQLQLSV